MCCIYHFFRTSGFNYRRKACFNVDRFSFEWVFCWPFVGGISMGKPMGKEPHPGKLDKIMMKSPI